MKFVLIRLITQQGDVTFGLLSFAHICEVNVYLPALLHCIFSLHYRNILREVCRGRRKGKRIRYIYSFWAAIGTGSFLC